MKKNGRKEKKNGMEAEKVLKWGEAGGGGLKNVFQTMLCWRQKDRRQKTLHKLYKQEEYFKEEKLGNNLFRQWFIFFSSQILVIIFQPVYSPSFFGFLLLHVIYEQDH